MKPSFIHNDHPLNTCMVQAKTVERSIELFRAGLADGCDAFGFQYEKLEKELHTEECVKKIFAEAKGLPIYVTSYRHSANDGLTDEELLDTLLDLVGWGATIADVMGDYFHREPGECTTDAEAVEKQKEAIRRIHAAGGEVLMSSHTFKFMTTEEVMKIALAHKERGADISKIVTAGNTPEEEAENLRTTAILKKELGIPFLFLSGGTNNRIHRTMGPLLGCNMWLTVHEYDNLATPSQPPVVVAKNIWETFNYNPADYKI